MKETLKYAICLLISALLISSLPTDAEADIYRDTIRLHIIANSNSNEDQRLKLDLRDGILLEYGEILRKFGTKSEAELSLREILPKIERTAQELTEEMGYNYRVRAELIEEWYETREYGDFSLPCGIYCSLRIIIGEGGGENWWCVMYPPLCTELASEDAPPDDGIIDYSKEEVRLIQSGKYSLKFKILEDLSRLFSKNG